MARCLDRFLIAQILSTNLPLSHQWRGESGHHHIYLEVKVASKNLGSSSFKFNASWLKEQSFHNLYKGRKESLWSRRRYAHWSIFRWKPKISEKGFHPIGIYEKKKKRDHDELKEVYRKRCRRRVGLFI